MSKNRKKTPDTPLGTPVEKRMLSVLQMAMVLTILDKEAHTSLYFAQMLPEETDHSYIENIRTIQSIFAENLDQKVVDSMLDDNPHLAHIFGKYDQLIDHINTTKSQTLAEQD